MSSSEAESAGGKRRPAKKQRVPKEGVSCDRCRKRKIQCNGRLGGEKCRYCSQNGWACEYLQAKRKYQVGYVKALEDKIHRLYGVLKRLHPTEDFTNEVGKPFTEENWPQEAYSKVTDLIPDSTLDEPSAFVSAAPNLTLTIKLDEMDIKIEEDSDAEDEHLSKLSALTDGFHHMSLSAYHGRHSNVDLVRSALSITYKITGAQISLDDLSRFGRPVFWQHKPWDCALPKRLSLEFPPPDLLQTLAVLYFEHQNIYMPVLHRPTFMRLLSMGLHNSDLSFGFLVLAVCANGARYSDDTRILSPGADSLSAGWIWFNQVWDQFPINNGSSRLYDLQCICLSTLYLMGCAATQTSWVWCGHGVRLAQDVGAHKKQVYGDVPTAEDEQYKRAFWILIFLDKHLGMCMARPNAAKEQDQDLDLPNTCDDEFWDNDDPSLAFKQPEGCPSRIDLLVCYMKLYQTVAPTMCLIFAGSKSRAMVGITDGWERPAVAYLDSRLTMWSESVPAHLRWNPDEENDVYLLQSAHLWTRFYELQINLHRPFIPSHSNNTKEAVSEIAFPSLSICLSASRTIVRIIECVQRRFPGQLFPFLDDPTFSAGMMLFLGIWGSSRFGMAPSRHEEDLQGIHTCERFLETLESRIHTAGRQRDVMIALLSLVEEPPTMASRGQKRTLDETQAPEESSTWDAPATIDFSALDDWFAGTQFDPTQLFTPSHPGPASISAIGQYDISSWTGGSLETTVDPDPLLTALGYTAPIGGYSLPLESWPLNGDRLYDGTNAFEGLF
ncbi:hypothetical protein PENSPDRAFT_647463 [Peniophora sp. CONT]|nr:hypothetical protein PENSPDRAFT_647463 [Peniophora sp. CONT]